MGSSVKRLKIPHLSAKKSKIMSKSVGGGGQVVARYTDHLGETF